MTAVGRIAVILSLLLGASGCVGSTAEPVGYEPVPDSELFAEVELLAGVLEADVSYDDSFTNGRNYLALLRVGRRVDVADIIDSTTAVLWQGRPDVSILVEVERRGSNVIVNSTSVGLSTRESLVQRYGPQPGDGRVPAGVPPLRVPSPPR
jgi:hypothetical protein